MSTGTFNPASPSSQATEVRVEELDSNGVVVTSLALTGRSLPYRPVRFSGSQRVVTTWHPGTRAASQQVMGPEEQPTTFRGRWKDKFLGAVGAARNLALVFDDFRRRGARLRLTWEAPVAESLFGIVGKAVSYEGVLSSFVREFDFPQEVTWEATFEWRLIGDAPGDVFVAGASLTPREAADNLGSGMSAMDQITDIASGLAGAISTANDSVRTQLEDVNAALLQLQTGLDSLAGQQGFSGDDPSVAAQSSTINTQIKDTVRIARDTYTVEEAAALGNADDVSSYLGAIDAYVDAFRVMDDLESRADDNVRRFAALLEPEVISQVRALPGTDLREIAVSVYGDADSWVEIARFNGFKDSKVPDLPAAGTPNERLLAPILVPRRSQATTRC